MMPLSAHEATTAATLSVVNNAVCSLNTVPYGPHLVVLHAGPVQALLLHPKVHHLRPYGVKGINTTATPSCQRRGTFVPKPHAWLAATRVPTPVLRDHQVLPPAPPYSLFCPVRVSPCS